MKIDTAIRLAIDTAKRVYDDSLSAKSALDYLESWILSHPPATPATPPAPAQTISLPIEWDVYPVVRVTDRNGTTARRIAAIGLAHRVDGREYRLEWFLFGDDPHALPYSDHVKATRAVFTLCTKDTP